MLPEKHNKSPALGLALLALTAVVDAACGPRRSGAGTPPYSLPDFVRSPAAVSAVLPGSFDVAAAPAPGGVTGALLLTLLGEPGAKLYYALRPFAPDGAETGLTAYTTPLLLLPPVTVFAQADVGGLRGPVRTFTYTEDPTWLAPIVPLVQRRLPSQGDPVPLVTNLDFTHFAAAGLSERLPAAPPMGGLTSDWSSYSSGKGRLMGMAPVGASPLALRTTEPAWIQAGETDEDFYVAIACTARPTSGQGRIYGIDFGPSNVTFGTFGTGATFVYRILATNGTLTVLGKDSNTPLPLSAASQVVFGDLVEFKLAKADLPLLGNVTDLALRAYGIDTTTGTTVTDRLEPIFLRSTFALDRGVVTADSRRWQVDVLADPRFPTDAVAAPYGGIAATVIPELEQLNQIRFRQTGTLPLYYVDKDESGYSGLNTTDRGVLTTIGPNTALMAKAQILAHELAHFQNARASQLKPRWLQEGMSEWSAERFLYRHFPRRAVHRFERQLRFDRYFDGLGGAPDAFPLANWGSEPSVLGYEKSLMFLDLLEARLGQPVLLKAFQQAVNDSLDTDGFKAFLEQETGKDLTDLFTFWVYPGQPAAGADPYKLFQSADGDDLLGLDEELLGTNPALADTDGDGYLDSEESFRGTDPLVSGLSAADLGDGSRPVLVGAEDPDTGALMRLGGAPGAKHRWSLNPFLSTPDQPYELPQGLRPPYTLLAQTTRSGQVGPLTTLTRDLWVGGKAVPADLPQAGILPAAPLGVATLRTDLVQGTGGAAAVGRGGGDLPFTVPAGLPEFLAPWDLTGARIEETASGLVITLKTRAPPSPYGEYGDYVVTFDTLTWTSTGPTADRQFAVTLEAGAPYFHVFDGATETSTLMADGVTWSLDTDLTLTIDPAKVASWRTAGGDKLVCVSTDLTLEGDNPLRSGAGCITLEAPGFSRAAAAVPDHFGLGTHTLEVFLDAGSATPARAQNLLALGTTALDEFEHVTGRPLWERHDWPAHVYWLSDAGAQTAGAATVRGGAYLSVPVAMPQSQVDYLFVEQLARLSMADLLDRSGNNPPYWVQEFYIQWLTASALYRFYPSRDVHAFHAGRIGDLTCYMDGSAGCAGRFSADVPLSGWTAASLKSTGSVKSLVFALEMDALLGNSVMGKVLGTYSNAVPEPATLKALFEGYAPEHAAAIDHLWQIFVDGSGDSAADRTAIRATLQDQDGDGLFLFEEQKLGTSDAVVNSYLQ